jgi:hypothetical protein
MHTNYVFDELRIAEKIATSLRTSHREIPRSKFFLERCKVCKGEGGGGTSAKACMCNDDKNSIWVRRRSVRIMVDANDGKARNGYD